jgi:hypothetical protein
MTSLDISALGLWIASAVLGAWGAWNLGRAINRRNRPLMWNCGFLVAVALACMTFTTLVVTDPGVLTG